MSMRTATVGPGIALAIIGAVASWIAVRHPPDRNRVRVQELPGWFGDAARPSARVAGKVIGAKRAMTVHCVLTCTIRENEPSPSAKTM